MGMEYRANIGGVMYGMKDIQSVTIEHPLFDDFSAGNACSAQLNITFWPIEDIPRMATIIPYCRENASKPWQKLGEFFIDTREMVGDAMSIVAYDAMLKGEYVWTPRPNFTFPCTMEAACQDVAYSMGVELDERNVFQPYTIQEYPPIEYTRRDLLRDVGAAHFGNWIMTNEGKLLLVPLFTTMPPETHYLVTEYGNAITFGGTRILV